MTDQRWRWFHWSLAAVWAVVTVLSVIFGWLDKVALVSWASLYANMVLHGDAALTAKGNAQSSEPPSK